MIVQVEGLDGDALTALNRKQPAQLSDVETWGKQVWVRAPLELDMPSQFCTPSPPKFWTVGILLGPAFARAAVHCKPRRPPNTSTRSIATHFERQHPAQHIPKWRQYYHPRRSAKRERRLSALQHSSMSPRYWRLSSAPSRPTSSTAMATR